MRVLTFIILLIALVLPTLVFVYGIRQIFKPESGQVIYFEIRMTRIAIVDGIRYAVKDVREGGMGKCFRARGWSLLNCIIVAKLKAKTF